MEAIPKILIYLIILPFSLKGQLDIEWVKVYGGEGTDSPQNIIQTPDSGYLISGLSNSPRHFIDRPRSGDFWIIKVDLEGKLLWERTFGGSHTDIPKSATITRDSFIVVTGYTMSNDYNVSQNYGEYDIWVIKVDLEGNLIWEKNFGSSNGDFGFSVISTKDGGVIIMGTNYSNRGTNLSNFDVDQNYGGTDCWVISLDRNGSINWKRNYGGSNHDSGISIISINEDREFLIAGTSMSSDHDLNDNYGWHDAWIFKIDNNGELLWSKNYGGSSSDYVYNIAKSGNDRFTIVGASHSEDIDLPNNFGNTDSWAFQIDENGELLWSENYGTEKQENLVASYFLKEKNILFFANSNYYLGAYLADFSEKDIWIFETDLGGKILWEKKFGGTGPEMIKSVVPAHDGGYIMTGICDPVDGDFQQTMQDTFEYYIIKLSTCKEFGNQIDTFICESKNLEFMEQIFNQEGEYQIPIEGINSCDSLIKLKLLVYPNDTVFLDTIICTPPEIIAPRKLKNSHGCDSIIQYNTFHIKELPNAGHDIFTCEPFAQLEARATNTPGISGLWSNNSSSNTLEDPSSQNTMVTNLSPGNNTFTWTLSHPNCPNFDQDEINVYYDNSKLETVNDTFIFPLSITGLYEGDIFENDFLPNEMD